MTDLEPEAQYKYAFTVRVKDARIAAGMKQWQVANALGIPQDKYKQYEGRSLLPQRLILRFCFITRVDPVWLLSGQGSKLLKPLHVTEGDTDPVAKPKRKNSKHAA